MAHRILYSRATSATGRLLGNVLGIRGAATHPDGERSDTLIRWGSSARVARRPRTVINRRQSIEAATDKLGSLLLLQQEHVRIPTIYRRGEVPNDVGIYPLLGRQRTHRQGADIVLCMQRLDLEHSGAEFYTKYIPTAREFRVHVFQGDILKISEKRLTNREEFQVPWIRNLENGYTFRNVADIRDRIIQQIEAAGKDAVEALRLDFGAVDVLLGDDGNVYVLEVNTGPSLGDNSLVAYVTKFAELLEIPEDSLNWPEDVEAPIPPVQHMEDVDEDELDDLF